MGVIKTNISKVYAKARDRANVHVYRKCVRTKCNVPMRIVHFNSGNSSLLKQPTRIAIYSKSKVQVPEKVYETFRLSVLKNIENVCLNSLKTDYCIVFHKYPHQLLRFHAIASGAKADRISEGMSNAFGTNFMKASKIKKGDLFFSTYLSQKYVSNFINLIKQMKKSCAKLPFNYYIIIEKNPTYPREKQ